MALETAVPIVWDVMKCVAIPIKDQLRYIICSKSYTQDLQEEVDKLNSHFIRFRDATEKARNNLGIVYDNVTGWQASAERALMEAQDLLDDFKEAAKTCCYRTLPDVNRLYQFSTIAEGKIENIQRLLRIGRDIQEIYFIGPIEEIELRDEGIFESRASILLHITDALADDSKSVVGVYGMGGVGKSSLLSDVKRIIKEQESFHWVALADLLGKQDVKSIQEEIANNLKLEMTNKENLKVRADLLRSRLDYEGKMKKKVLIILDNLSEKLELKTVGIPCEYNNKVKGCKLLLTSRDRNVLTRDMHCDSDSVFRLPELHEDEAKRLFHGTMGEKAHQDDFKPFVDKALDKCAGLPLLIVKMANHFRDASPFELNDALNQIEMSKNEGICKTINDMIQSSYDHLYGDDIKSFLRLCVVYGVPMPKRENLVRYGMGYVLVSNYESMKYARDRLNTLISTLEASSLSLDNGDTQSFKIHDLVRNFIALVNSRDHPLLVLKDQDKSDIQLLKNKLESCTALCFPYIDMKNLPKELDCPELLIFLMFTCNESLEVSDSYFISMRKLIVLNLTGIRLTRSSPLPSPSPFRLLEKLHTLCLDDCSLEDVSILGELKVLKILSFVNSKIHRLPNEIGQLVELRLLDLNNCLRLQIIEPDLLGRLTKLEELYIENSFDQWNAVEPETPRTNASLIELNNMKNLRTLHVSIPDPSVLPEDLEVEKLFDYKIQIGDVLHLSSYEVSKTLMIKLNPGSTILWNACIQTMLHSTDNLYLDRLNRTGQSICNLSQETFPKLKHLCVENSTSVLYILIRSSHTAFQSLESLILKNLINLEKICQSYTFSKSFNSLKEVRIEMCAKMEVLFPFPLARELPQLKEIGVVGCKSIQKIVEVDDCGKVEFRHLHVVELRNLPGIKNFFTARTSPSNSTSDDHVGTQVAFFHGQQVLIPSLESLTMVGLPNLKDIWNDKSPMGLSNLQSLKVVLCESLSKVINFGSLVKLHKLQTLIVADCVLVQEIFDLDRTSANGNVEIPCQLTSLHLKELPSLERIWNKNPCGIVRFHYLKQLKVFGCDNLKFMFFPSMVKSLVQLRELKIQNCKIMEAIMTNEEGFSMETSETLTFPMLTYLCFERLESLTCFYHEKCSREVRNQNHVESCSTALFNGKVAFPRLETLKIIGMDNIEMIWDSQVAADSFPTLKSLSVDECSKLVNIGPSCILRWLCNLEQLEAKACGSVQSVFKLQPPNSQDENDVACLRLKQLQLIELPELKCVWDRELFHQVNFECPHSINVSKCKNLTSLFPASIAKDLLQLEESEIDECGHLELIESTSHASHWPPLKTLEVHGGNKADIVALQPKNEVSLHKQHPILIKKGIDEEAKEGPSRELNIYAFSAYFQHLKTLKLSHCDGLSKMFTPAIAKNLVRLTELKISYCKMLTEVISDEGGKKEHVVIFNQLKNMELDGLTGLRCFSMGRCTLKFPLLEDIIVTECLNMELFSRGSIAAPKVKRVQVSREASYWNENLNMTIQSIYEKMAMIVGVKFIRISEFPELFEKWHGEIYPIKSSWQLESLVVDNCASFINAIPSKLMLVLNNMRRLQVRNCKSLEEILDLKGLETGRSTLLLRELRHLDLVNLPKLRQLWNKDLQGNIRFNCLYYLTLYKCSDLRHAFVPSMAQCFANLERMEIKECCQMEGVIVEEEGQGHVVEKITFPRLNWMKLECLPNLTSFLLGKNHRLDCPRLEHLIIAHCPKMRSLTWQSLMENDHGTSSLFTPQVQFRRLESMVISHMDSLSKIWTESPRETFVFKYLRKVEAQNCKSLEIMFPHKVATSLSQLEELRVESCRLEEIVMREDDTPHFSTTQVIFPELTSLALHDMPRLKNFSSNLPTLNWPFLKELRVTHCDKLNMLSFVSSMDKWAQGDDNQVLSDQDARSSLERDFPNLDRLLLVEKNIQMIQDGEFLDDIFTKPKALILACFHEKRASFPPSSLLERFKNLQSLEVFCSSFEDIFPNEELVDEGKRLVLENLRELKLSKLHNLKRVWREDYLVSKVLQSIQMLEVSDCPSLITLFPTVTSFQNLMKLVVKNSSGLIHLVTLLAVTNLVHLMDMTIIGCERMEEVVANDGNGDGKVISLLKLKSLRLQNLPSLVCFSSTKSHILELPSLIDIVVEDCPRMKIFSKSMLSTPNLHSATLFGYFWEAHLEGDLNSTIQKLSA